MTDTALSRSGTTSALGKNDKRLDVLISDELDQAITAMAAIRGVPKSEFARTVLEQSMFGSFSMLQKMAGKDR